MKEKLHRVSTALFFNEAIASHKNSADIMTYHALERARYDMPVIVLCEAYADTYRIVCAAARTAVQRKKKSSTSVDTCIEHVQSVHMRAAYGNVKDSQASSAHTEATARVIQALCNDIRMLLIGVSKLKEISGKTESALRTITSALAAHSLAARLRTTGCDVRLITDLAKPPTVYKLGVVYIAALRNPHLASRMQPDFGANADMWAALWATHTRAACLDVWTRERRIMAAPPQYVPRARAVQYLTYGMALEIALLGGKVFHPSALHMLMKKNIPIAVYSDNTQKQKTQPTTYIASEIPPNTTQSSARKNTGAVIVNQNNFTLCTVRSTNMFHRYGYLERMFAVCSRHGVSVETLTTSEISVTMTFASREFSRAFAVDLRTVGEVQFEHDYSLISIISRMPWNNPRDIAAVLQSIQKNISIETLSVSKAGLSFSFAVQRPHVQSIVRSVHKVLHE